MVERKKVLLDYLSDKTSIDLVENLVDEIIFLENQLEVLKKLPFIKVHPDNPEIQKATPASKQYVSLLAQYNANIRTLARLSGTDEIEEDSPLRAWARANVDKK